MSLFYFCFPLLIPCSVVVVVDSALSIHSFIVMQEGDKEHTGLSLPEVPFLVDCGHFCNITLFGFTVSEYCHSYRAPPEACFSVLGQPEYLGL